TTTSDFCFATATELARRIRDREISSAEVTEAFLARIAAHNSTLNAIVHLLETDARARAKEADEADPQLEAHIRCRETSIRRARIPSSAHDEYAGVRRGPRCQASVGRGHRALLRQPRCAARAGFIWSGVQTLQIRQRTRFRWRKGGPQRLLR